MKKIKKPVAVYATPTDFYVKCYRNLNRKGVVWSLLNSKTGLVDSYAHNVFLEDVTFKVSQAGRNRVLKQKRKNVHAFVTGKVCSKSVQTWKRATYNPYKDVGFHLVGENRILTKVKYAMLCETGLWVVE